ncbi:hypothetical protein ABZ614_13620 [Streptomyces sp. NPDC013178]|uniref:hypothetical protein n=1 Tax=Streptomyces sp. NPDC013178 TaxID=3155118 RepID=UPI00340E6867
MTGEFERPEGGRRGDLHQIGDLLQQGLRRLAPEGARIRVRVGRGGLDETGRLFTGGTDIAVVTPAAALSLLYRFGDLQGLFALGVIQRRGGLVVAADARLRKDTVADLVTRGDRVTIATSADDGVNLVGFAVRRALRMAGVDAVVDFVHDEQPTTCCERFAKGEADVVIHDLMSAPEWPVVAATRPVKYLAWGPRVLHGLAGQGWPTRVVPAGRLPGLEADLPTLDCSNFAVLCREDLDDELAGLTARFLARGHHPADAAEVARAPLPLHPGASRAYADLFAAVPLRSR